MNQVAGDQRSGGGDGGSGGGDGGSGGGGGAGTDQRRPMEQ